MRRRSLLSTIGLLSLAGCQTSETSTDTQSPTINPQNIEARIVNTSIDLQNEVSWKAFLRIEFTLSESEVTPTLRVENADGDTLYSNTQDDDDPATVELPIEVVRQGGTYTVELLLGEEQLASKTVSFSGGSLVIESFELTMDEGFENEYQISESTLTLRNEGNMAIPFDEIVAEMGSSELNAQYTITGGIIETGQTKEYTTATPQIMRAAEYDVLITLLFDDETLGQATTTYSLGE